MGIAKAKEGDHVAALTYFQKAYQIDPGVAILCYQMGLSKRALGETEDAKRLLRQASDSDGFCARMSTQFGPVVRKMAESFQNVRFHDLAKTMEDMVDLGYDWNNLFIDLHHPSFLGHSIITQAALDELTHFEDFHKSNSDINSDFKKMDYGLIQKNYITFLGITARDQMEKALQRIEFYLNLSNLCAYPTQAFNLVERDLRLLGQISGIENEKTSILIDRLLKVKSLREIDQKK